MDNPTKLATFGTQNTRRGQTNKTKYNNICVGHHHTQDEDKQIKKHKMQANKMLERYQSNNNPFCSKGKRTSQNKLEFRCSRV